MLKWNGVHGRALAHLFRMEGEHVIARPFIGTGISNAERCVGIRAKVDLLSCVNRTQDRMHWDQE